MKKYYHRIFKFFKGFSFIEVIIATAIVGILSSIVFSTVSFLKIKAHDISIKSTISSLRSSAENRYYDFNPNTYYPVCYTEPINLVLEELGEIEGVVPADYQCVSAPNAWVAAFPLKSGGYWCSDSTGDSKKIESLITDITTPDSLKCVSAVSVVTATSGSTISSSTTTGTTTTSGSTGTTTGGSSTGGTGSTAGGGYGGIFPSIILSGVNPYQLNTNKTNPFDDFVEPGYVSNDPEDGVLTNMVVVSGPTLRETEGRGKCAVRKYELNYTVTDAGGQSTSVTRLVFHHPCNN